jgi:hypothetical protein
LALAWTRSESGGFMVRPTGCGDLGAGRTVAATILHENASNFHAGSGLGHAAYALPLSQVAISEMKAVQLSSDQSANPPV